MNNSRTNNATSTTFASNVRFRKNLGMLREVAKSPDTQHLFTLEWAIFAYSRADWLKAFGGVNTDALRAYCSVYNALQARTVN